MVRIHFLNVSPGDCTLIEHHHPGLMRATLVDICRVGVEQEPPQKAFDVQNGHVAIVEAKQGNYQMKNHLTDPLEYLDSVGIRSIFRFVITHPDMDHLSGIKALFEKVDVLNVWDTENSVEKTSFGSGYSEEDWTFYTELRSTDHTNQPKRLTLYSGQSGSYWSKDESGVTPGDGITVLAPFKDRRDALEASDADAAPNDYSYALLIEENGFKVVLGGDVDSATTWERIIKEHGDRIRNIDVLIAPHHGRKLDDTSYLDHLNPMLVLLGNTESNTERLDYGAFKCTKFTSNECGDILLELGTSEMHVYCSNESFAQDYMKSKRLLHHPTNSIPARYWLGSIKH